jgi:crotonobetainyl-CoA:carnitine CoA-transferase CaiB-like acyl-CoA transferase
MLAFVVAAALWQRRKGGVARVDFSMIEAMLWTLAKPLLAAQSGAPPVPRGNQSDGHVLHGAWRCAGDDAWISIAVGSEEEAQNLRAATGGDVSENALAEWLRDRSSREAEAVLQRAGVAAAVLASSVDLVASEHLRARGFWEAQADGVLPGLPWRASFGRRSGEAPGLGADTETVLTEMLGLSADDIDALRRSGALG